MPPPLGLACRSRTLPLKLSLGWPAQRPHTRAQGLAAPPMLPADREDAAGLPAPRTLVGHEEDSSNQAPPPRPKTPEERTAEQLAVSCPFRYQYSTLGDMIMSTDSWQSFKDKVRDRLPPVYRLQFTWCPSTLLGNWCSVEPQSCMVIRKTSQDAKIIALPLLI